MAHKGRQASQGRRLHLEVGDASLAKAERLDLGIQIHILWLEAHPTSLRSVEARRSDGDTLASNILEELEQTLVGIYEIRCCELWIPTRMFNKGLLDSEVADIVAACIVVKQAVEAHRGTRKDSLANLNILLQGSRSTQSQQSELLELILDLSGGKVDIGQSIQLRNHDVDVVGADTRGERSHTTSLVRAGDGLELAACHVALHIVEVGGYHIYTCRVAHQYHNIRDLLGTKVKVKYRTVLIYNQFRCGNHSFFAHILIVFGFTLGYLA